MDTFDREAGHGEPGQEASLPFVWSGNFSTLTIILDEGGSLSTFLCQRLQLTEDEEEHFRVGLNTQILYQTGDSLVFERLDVPEIKLSYNCQQSIELCILHIQMEGAEHSLCRWQELLHCLPDAETKI